MSLHNAAKHIAAHGRGEDTVLVHMTPNEVSGLQSVAKAHGGSLTINPHTGLAEAGFLRGLLPTLLGAGLAATGVGAPMAALMVGGGYTVASGGDLKKGLMAGLGAYGGAGMANSFGAAGASSVPTATPVTPAPVIPEGIANAGPSTFSDPFNVAPSIPPAPSNVAASLPSGPAGSTNYINAEAANYSLPPSPSPSPISIDGMGVSSPTAAPKSFADMNVSDRLSAMKQGASFENAGKFIKANPYTTAGTAASIYSGSKEEPKAPDPADPGMIRPYTFERTKNADAFQDTPASGYAPMSSKERRYFTDQYTALTPYKAPGPEYKAAGGPVEEMSNQVAMGANTMYPMANMATSSFATPYQSPVSTNMLSPTSDSPVGMTGEPSMQGTRMAGGGQVPQYGLGGALGGYSDGGRMLKGPGDGMSDNIPAVIGKKQPARLADGEFVVPADVVSHLGNGSTDAGAKQLYAMMDKIRAARTGTKKQGKQINPRKYMPA